MVAPGLLAAGLFAGPLGAQQSQLVLVRGLGGEPKYDEAFDKWATALRTAATANSALPAANVHYLAPKAEPGTISGISTAQGIEAAFDSIAKVVGPSDQIVIVLFGHGAERNGESRFNLPGPDLTAEDFSRMLARFPTQKIAFVNTASASGEFIQALSGPRRTVITATRSGGQNNETIFGEFFVQAFTGDGADTDKDGHVSLLEAFDFARREVARHYDSGGLMATEQSLLDDNGDRKGSREPDPRSGDGAVARGLFLSIPGSSVAATSTSTDPRIAGLYQERRALEQRIEDLKAQKGTMEQQRYDDELERLLVELAEKAKTIREIEGGKP